MRKVTIKRVFLVDEAYPRTIVLDKDYFGTLSDEAILSSLCETGKDVWIGHNLYHIVKANGQIRHLRYEVVTVTQYVPSWYNNLFLRLAGLSR